MPSNRIPADRIGPSFVPRKRPDVSAVGIGDEVVLLDGWKTATALDGAAVLIWDAFDGCRSITEISRELATSVDIDPAPVIETVLRLVGQLGALGLLEGVDLPGDVEPPKLVEGVGSNRDVGDLIADVTGTDLSGNGTSLAAALDADALVVNWSPHCGHCASIADGLAAVGPHLRSNGIGLVMLASGGTDANREVAERTGLNARFVVLDDGAAHPLPGCGTPAAFHLDASRRILTEPAYGNVAVPELAANLAGVDLDAATGDGAPGVPEGTRYLLERGGACAPPGDVRPAVGWAGARVYRLGDFHIGIRIDSDATGATLDALFPGARVADPRAGHSFSVALPGLEPGPGRSPGGLNLFFEGGSLKVRSRSVSRVLRALLWHIETGTTSDQGTQVERFRTRATAAIVDGRAVLLQPGLFVLDGLQA